MLYIKLSRLLNVIKCKGDDLIIIISILPIESCNFGLTWMFCCKKSLFEFVNVGE